MLIIEQHRALGAHRSGHDVGQQTGVVGEAERAIAE